MKKTRYDTNLVVIGAGSGGLVSAYIAAAINAKVTLIERDKMGGDCLNTGCVPSKALIRSAKLAHEMRNAHQWGITATEPEIDFDAVMARVRSVIQAIEPHDSIERYTKLGVDVVIGEANIVDPHTVTVNGETIRTPAIIVATGAKPFVPTIPGIEDSGYLTSDTLWSLRECPQKLLIIGGGPIGCELAQAFSRLGSTVTQVEAQQKLMGREDPDVADFIQQRFEQEGIRVMTNHQVKRFIKTADSREVVITNQQDNTDETIAYDRVIIAAGREANVTGFGLEALGVEVDRTIQHNAFLQTNIPNIYVCGDVAGPYQFTHAASHQAWHAAVNALFKPFKRFTVDYRVMPWATFTDPEIARVGLNETEAAAANIAYEVTRYDLADSDRALADGEAQGWVKVLTRKGKDEILGATIVGSHGSELIAEFVLAMKYRLGLKKLLSTIHIYPTWAEANKSTAGLWRQAHKPEWLLKQLRHFWRWRRRG